MSLISEYQNDLGCQVRHRPLCAVYVIIIFLCQRALRCGEDSVLSEGRGEGEAAGNASGNDKRQVQMRMNIADENMA